MATRCAAISFWLLAALACGAGETSLPGLDDVPLIVAEVNGAPVCRNDLVRELVGSAGSDALDRLVRRMLIEQAARKLNITVTDEDVERQLVIDKRDLNEALIKDFTDVNKEFPLAELIRARFHMTLDEYKSLVVRQRLIIRRCVAKDLAPTEAQLLGLFQEHRELFEPPTVYHASHILISPLDPRDLYRGLRCRSPLSQMAALDADRQRRMNLYRDYGIDVNGAATTGDEAWRKFLQANPNVQLGAPPVDELQPAWEAARKRAEKVLAEIRSGAISWDQAVRRYTQDPLDRMRTWPDGKKESERDRLRPPLPPGNVGRFHARGPLVEEFYKGAKDIPPGQFGGPIKTEFGYHLVKMIGVQAPAPASFEKVRDQVARVYMEREILARAEDWLKDLVTQADLRAERTLLWPPLPAAGRTDDPPVGSVNGTVLKRSEVWRELLRSDSDEALGRLIHFEIVMTMLRNLGLERLEWESADPAHRAPQPPRPTPITINAEAVELELNADRLRKDREAPDMQFKDYVYLRYGQSVDDYKRKLEGGLILREAIRRRVPVDDGTLRVQFALSRHLYAEPARYELSHILIKPTGGMDKADTTARMAAQITADSIYKLCVAQPEKFGQFVQEHSMDGPDNKARQGSLGTCYPDVRNTEFPEAPTLYAEVKRQRLARGQISSPIKSSRGWHIVRVDDVHPEVRAEFDQVKGRLERDYLQEQAKMYTDLWLRALTAQAKVKRYLFEGGNAPPSLPRDNFPVPREP